MRVILRAVSAPILGFLLCACVAGDNGGGGASAGGGSEADSVVVTSRYDLDAANVPSALRHLVPLAQRWGIGDDVERYEYAMQASAAERATLREAVVPYYDQIAAWLDSFGSGPMSDEAAAFMYMQLAIEETVE